MADAKKVKAIGMDPFCFKNFKQHSDRGFLSMTPAAFTDAVNDWFDAHGGLVDGYAPFCKHIFMENPYDEVCAGTMEIDDENIRLLYSDYIARTADELPVLSRWFRKSDVTAPKAAYLDVILYSREQLIKEAEAKNQQCEETELWGIVAIKPQMINTELPMEPITMMRNALGKAEGGSGVPLKHDLYKQSCDFWKQNARIL